MYYRTTATLLLFSLTVGAACGAPNESRAGQIARAMSAGPISISAHATIIDMSSSGKTIVLRKGSNAYTCYIGHKGVTADDPFCADRAGMQWTSDWTQHKPRPTNTKPGIIYMFAGGTDWSATDPFATKGTPIHEAPHWMIMYPFDAKTSGLPTGFKNSGTWIMWANTPYAHLMVQEKS